MLHGSRQHLDERTDLGKTTPHYIHGSWRNEDGSEDWKTKGELAAGDKLYGGEFAARS